MHVIFFKPVNSCTYNNDNEKKLVLLSLRVNIVKLDLHRVINRKL